MAVPSLSERGGTPPVRRVAITIDNVEARAFAGDYHPLTGSGIRHSKGSMAPLDRKELRLPKE